MQLVAISCRIVGRRNEALRYRLCTLIVDFCPKGGLVLSNSFCAVTHRVVDIAQLYPSPSQNPRRTNVTVQRYAKLAASFGPRVSTHQQQTQIIVGHREVRPEIDCCTKLFVRLFWLSAVDRTLRFPVMPSSFVVVDKG